MYAAAACVVPLFCNEIVFPWALGIIACRFLLQQADVRLPPSRWLLKGGWSEPIWPLGGGEAPSHPKLNLPPGSSWFRGFPALVSPSCAWHSFLHGSRIQTAQHVLDLQRSKSCALHIPASYALCKHEMQPSREAFNIVKKITKIRARVKLLMSGVHRAYMASGLKGY